LSKVNREIFFNTISSVASILVSSLVLFYLYRVANHQIGLEQIGLWSIVMTVTSVGSIGSFGFSGSLLKFTADLKAKGNSNDIPGILNSSILLIGILLIAFLGIIYLGSLLILDQFVDTRYIDIVFTILPLSFLIFYISTIGYLVLSTIEGLNKNWQKNIVVVGCQLIMLICALIWMPKFGVFGIFYAQLVQAISLLLSALTLVKINVPSYTVSALNRKKETMKSIMVYGLKFQAQSILLMLCDPVTKMFLSRYGGLSYVGIYEMASRAVLQVRTIIVSMVSNLVPKIVHIHSRNNEEEIRQSFKNVFNVNFDFFIFIFGAMILFAPLGVQVWLGKPNPELTWFIQVLSVGWFLNSVALVPYIFNLGSGHLNGNVISHAIMAGLNIIIGLLIILSNLEAQWFIYGWMVALAVGSIYVLLEYLRRHYLYLGEIFTFHKSIMVFIAAAGIIIIHLSMIYSVLPPLFIVGCIGAVFLGAGLVYLRYSATYSIMKRYFESFIKLQSR